MTEGTLGDDGVRDVGPAELDRAVEHGRLGHHGKGRIAMSDQDAFARILASLYGAMLDDTRWPATSALIDEACGITGNALLVGEGPPDDIRVLLRRALLPGAAPGRPRARLRRKLPSHRRSAYRAFGNFPTVILVHDPRPLHGRGVEDLTVPTMRHNSPEPTTRMAVNVRPGRAGCLPHRPGRLA